MGWGGPGINRLDSGPQEEPLLQPPSHPCLPTLEGGPWREKAALGLGPSFPHPTSQTSQRGKGPALSSFNTDSHRAQNLSPLPPKPLKVAGGGGEERSRPEQVQRKQMLVPEFYLRGWGERRAGSGGVFGDPQGPLWCKLGGAGDTEAGAEAQRGGVGWL